MSDISAREIILAKSGMEDIMKQTWVTLTRKAAVCLLAVPVLAGLSGCTQKLADPTSTKQTKEAQATPTGTPFPYYASMDDEPRTISGKCGDHAEWSYSTGTKVLTIHGSGTVDRVVDSDTSKQKIEGLAEPYEVEERITCTVKKIKIEEGITALEAGNLFGNVFKDDDAKEIKLSLPDSLERINVNTFAPTQDAVYIRKIHLPRNVRYIEGGAFWGLGTTDTSDTFRENLTITVDSRNPYYMTENNVLFTKDKKTLVYYPGEKKEQTYCIPESVTKVKALAFSRNPFLKKVVLPTGITDIGAGAFYGDSKLGGINLAQAVKVKKLRDFDGVKAKLSYYDVAAPADAGEVSDEGDEDVINDEQDLVSEPEGSAKYLKEFAMLGTFAGTNLKEIQFPDSLKYAGYSTFCKCFCLKKITLGTGYAGQINPVNYCDKNGFLLPGEKSTDCFDIQLPVENKNYKVRGNVIYSGDGRTVYGVTKDYQKSTLTLDKNVKVITRNAFRNTKLKKVTVSGDLTIIGSGAFMNNWYCRSFEVKGNINLIDAQAFYECHRLKKFVCGGTIKKIGTQAFRGAIKKDGVVLEDSLEDVEVGEEVF